MKKQKVLFLIFMFFSSCISKQDFFEKNVKYTAIIVGSLHNVKISNVSINIEQSWCFDLTHAEDIKGVLRIDDSINVKKLSDVYLIEFDSFACNALLIPESKINELYKKQGLKDLSEEQAISMMNSYFDYIRLRKIRIKDMYDGPIAYIGLYLYENGFSPIFEQRDYSDLCRKYDRTIDSLMYSRLVAGGY